jgi:HipA-like C-terminal domain
MNKLHSNEASSAKILVSYGNSRWFSTTSSAKSEYRMSAIVTTLTRWGALSSSDLYRRVSEEFGSERSYQRALRDTPDLVRFGHTKNRGYALRRPEMPPVPLYMRGEDGRDVFLGDLLALQANQWVPDTGGAFQSWMRLGQLSDPLEVYQGLPWFMEAFRPAGFLGRAWVREHATAHGWPLDVNAWTEDQVLTGALQQPWDWRGNLSIGPFVDVPDYLVPAGGRREEYAKRADQVLDGVMVGASADGEQPKFTAVVDEGHAQRAVLVKFSPPLTDNPAARRWADVMVTEAVASQVLTLYGMSSAATEVWLHGDRLWLETTRFDRIGSRGRRGMASLRSLAQTFNYQGPQHGWVGAMEHLQRHGAINTDQVVLARRLAAIGHLILNNDMHMGNLSFLLSNDEPSLSIAPVYDMTPMRWVPSTTGSLVPPLQQEPVAMVDDSEALAIAYEIWNETARHELVSDEWREWSGRRAQQILTEPGVRFIFR